MPTTAFEPTALEAVTLESPATTTAIDTYSRLMDLVSAVPASHRVIDHAPEGRTDVASLLRGHPLRQAAKSIVVRVALSKKARRYVLAVVQGDQRVDLEAVRRVVGGVRAGFADRATAERLSGCVSGSIVPFSFHPDLWLIADPGILNQDEVVFNAARLDRSLALPPHVYRGLASPTVALIAEPAASNPGSEPALLDGLDAGLETAARTQPFHDRRHQTAGGTR